MILGLQPAPFTPSGVFICAPHPNPPPMPPSHTSDESLSDLPHILEMAIASGSTPLDEALASVCSEALAMLIAFGPQSLDKVHVEDCSEDEEIMDAEQLDFNFSDEDY